MNFWGEGLFSQRSAPTFLSPYSPGREEKGHARAHTPVLTPALGFFNLRSLHERERTKLG